MITKFLRGRSMVALTDQALISGSNFATNIVLVRALGLSIFGEYSIAFMILTYVNSLQMSFIGSPMLTLAPLMDAERKRGFVNGMFTLQLLASALLGFVFCLVGVTAHWLSPKLGLDVLLVYAFAIGTYQLQDWLRRYYFVYAKARFTLLSDFLSYFVQLAILVALWRLGKLSLLATFIVMVGTSVAGFLIGPLTDPLRPSRTHLREAWNASKSLSRDLLVASQLRWFGIQGVLLIGTSIVGTTAAGGLRATLGVAGVFNLILFSIENVAPIRIGEELKKNGAAGAFRLTRRSILLGMGIFASAVLPLTVFGRPILRVLYGPAMLPFYWPMVLQLVCVIAQIASTLWVYFYRSLRNSKALMGGAGVNTLVSVLTVFFFGHWWSAVGIVMASFVGLVAGVLFFTFYWLKNNEGLAESNPGEVREFSAQATTTSA